MARRKQNSLERSECLHHEIWGSWFNRLYSIAIASFKWEGLPLTVDPWFLEMILFWQGRGLYFWDSDELGELFLPFRTEGQLDMYNQPAERRPYSTNYNGPLCDRRNSVIVYDNYSRFPVWQTVQLYAQQLAEIDRIIRVNVKAQRTPTLIVCDDKERLSAENLWAKYDGDVPFIYGPRSLNSMDFKVLKTDAPFLADRLQILKRQLFNEVCIYLGVEASTNEKAERLVSPEVDSNMGAVEAMRLARLEARRWGAQQINAIFGTNITVSFNSALRLNQLMEGVEPVGDLHNASQDVLRESDEA